MEDRQRPIETVYRSRDKKACFEQTLVLEAAGIRHEIQREADEFVVLVAVADGERARAELAAYAHENLDRPIRVEVLPRHTGAWLGVYGFVALLLVADILKNRNVLGWGWFDAGRAQAELIRQGQWWRTVTALTLHADAAHLIGNIIVGSLFGLFAAQLLGPGLAWLCVLTAGAGGNALDALVRPPEHTSIGASTAVFAALGLVASYAWTRRRHLNLSAPMRWAPIVGGVILLGYLGTGGARTDVFAHVAGFGCGALLGAIFGQFGDHLVLTTRGQSALGLIALAIVVLAWAAALSLGRT